MMRKRQQSQVKNEANRIKKQMWTMCIDYENTNVDRYT